MMFLKLQRLLAGCFHCSGDTNYANDSYSWYSDCDEWYLDYGHGISSSYSDVEDGIAGLSCVMDDMLRTPISHQSPQALNLGVWRGEMVCRSESNSGD